MDGVFGGMVLICGLWGKKGKGCGKVEVGNVLVVKGECRMGSGVVK